MYPQVKTPVSPRVPLHYDPSRPHPLPLPDSPIHRFTNSPIHQFGQYAAQLSIHVLRIGVSIDCSDAARPTAHESYE